MSDSDSYVSWGGDIVVLEPAPWPARAARYTAPKIGGDEPWVAAMFGGVFGGFIVCLASGGAVYALASWPGGPLAGQIAVAAWFVALAVWLLASYLLVGRYGLRRPRHAPPGVDVDRLWVQVQAGNIAWRALPAAVQDQRAEQLRVLNAAARLLTVDPTQADAAATVTQLSGKLQREATTLLDDASPNDA